MKSSRRLRAASGALFCLGILLGCGGSQQSPGVTNAQPATPQIGPYKAPVGGQCLSRGDACLRDNDCCSQWCVNGDCAIRQP